jgi:hypothetical protein
MAHEQPALAKPNADSPKDLRRPKGMHSRTYERLMREIMNEEEFFDAATLARSGFEI